jgi:3-oxoacyl-[acyl-carrier-protein] synthase II
VNDLDRCVPDDRRVPDGRTWITGVGTATPLGLHFPEFADRVLAGASGIDRVAGFDVSEHPSQIAGQLPLLPTPPGLDAAEFASRPRVERVLLWSAVAALRDAGLWERRHELRIGMAVGLGGEWLLRWESDGLAGGDLVYHPQRDAESILHRACRTLGLSGPVASVSAACASGNYALAQARWWLEMGWIDVCLAGACDAAVTPMSLAGFGNLRALSRRNSDPRGASRPFDRARDGFVMSEGGALFALERAGSVRRRGAPVYAELAGFGAASDAHNMVIPSPDPEPAARAVRQALVDARVAPADIDYLNAHATSTPVGDVAETRVLHLVLGEAAAHVPVSSTKSTTGHALTAAAAVEALACVAAIQRRALPPTINLDDPDPECRLCHVANTAWERPVHVAVSNSFGFGGSNTCIVLKAA